MTQEGAELFLHASLSVGSPVTPVRPPPMLKGSDEREIRVDLARVRSDSPRIPHGKVTTWRRPIKVPCQGAIIA